MTSSGPLVAFASHQALLEGKLDASAKIALKKVSSSRTRRQRRGIRHLTIRQSYPRIRLGGEAFEGYSPCSLRGVHVCAQSDRERFSGFPALMQC